MTPQVLHKLERLATVDLSGCIYIEVPKSIDCQATDGFRSLQSLDLRCASPGRAAIVVVSLYTYLWDGRRATLGVIGK